MNVERKKILITGSTGFIGSHLAKRLVHFKDTKVRGLVKDNTISTNRIDWLPVEKVFGDMTSLQAMRTAVQGCDVVVHCAIGNPDENYLGTRNVIQAALENDVKKFVHISSTAVFGYSPDSEKVKDGRLSDNFPRNEYYTEYSYGKIASEKVAFGYYDYYQLPLVVLRLSHVFGPYSTCWTTRPIRMIQHGCYTLVNGGISPSNTIYIDNAIDAIVLAIKAENAVGKALIVNDEKITPWNDFFVKNAEMLTQQYPLLGVNQSYLKHERARQKVKLLKRLFSNPSKIYSTLQKLDSYSDGCILSSMIKKGNFKGLTKKIRPRITNNPLFANTPCAPPKLPEVWLEKSFTIPFQFPINGAKEVLGFTPRVPFEEAILKTKRWLNNCETCDYSFGYQPAILA